MDAQDLICKLSQKYSDKHILTVGDLIEVLEDILIDKEFEEEQMRRNFDEIDQH